MSQNNQELDARVAKVEAAYQAAIDSGQISPGMDIVRFADMIADDIDFLDTPAMDGFDERVESERAVNSIIKGGRDAEGILGKWFGTKGKE